MRSQFTDSPEFQRLLRSEPRPDLIRVALEIARDAYPEIDVPRYLDRVDSLTLRIRDRTPVNAKPRHVLGQINWVLFVEEGFHGNSEDYYDPRNSYLNEVIDRKTGIPISLSILYWTLAERLGLTTGGLNLPVHFMLHVDDNGAPIFVDPFHAGVILDRHGCQRRISDMIGRRVELTEEQLSPCGRDRVVARMLRNLKVIYLETHDYLSAFPVQRRLAALNRHDPEEQRDLGMLCLRIDRPADSIEPLEAYVAARPDSADGDSVRALLRTARREVALWN